MRRVTYSMGMTLDGYVMGPDGGIDWGVPDDELFAFVTEQIQQVGVHLLGRRLYETMLYWDTADQDPALDEPQRRWAQLWQALPKVVFSTTLTAVEGANTRLASGTLAEEIARLRKEPAAGDIAIGGAELAHQAADAALVDEYRVRVHPVLLGGGTPYFARNEQRSDLELIESRTFASGVVYLRHRVR
jgi:dihydrofolate reductase